MNRSEHISANLWLCAILNNIFQCMLKQLASSKPGKNVILDTCYSHGQQHMQSIIIKMLQQLWQELTRIRAMDILSFLHVSNWQCKMLTYCVLNIASWGSCSLFIAWGLTCVCAGSIISNCSADVWGATALTHTIGCSTTHNTAWMLSLSMVIHCQQHHQQLQCKHLRSTGSAAHNRLQQQIQHSLTKLTAVWLHV